MERLEASDCYVVEMKQSPDTPGAADGGGRLFLRGLATDINKWKSLGWRVPQTWHWSISAGLWGWFSK